MNNFWNIWIIGLTVLTLIGILWLLLANRKTQKMGDDNKTGHEYDGIEEYDNPLPAWWMNMFILTIIFSIGYLVAYPGMGSFKGMLGWTQVQQYEKELHIADAEFLAVYQQLLDQKESDGSTIEALAKNDKAVKMGQRLFSTNCTVCHGADAGGARGYPDLRDKDWLYGGDAETIKASITHGRQGMMPAWGPVLGADQAGQQKLVDVANYVWGMCDNKDGASPSAVAGKQVYLTYCAACHGEAGDGNPMMGAPRLNDELWLYGGSMEAIHQSIRDGRAGQMPAHMNMLSEERINLISAYVYSLSHNADPE